MEVRLKAPQIRKNIKTILYRCIEEGLYYDEDDCDVIAIRITNMLKNPSTEMALYNYEIEQPTKALGEKVRRPSFGRKRRGKS